MAGIVSGFVSLKFIQLLTKPFKKWPAYKMGLINEKGFKVRDAATKDEKKEFASWMNIIRKIKIMLERFAPGGKVAQLASFATALYLLKEDIDKNTKWDGNDIINIIAQDIFLVDESLNEVTRLEVLRTGKYIIEHEFVDSNNLILLKASQGPTEWFFGVPMFEVKDAVSGKTFIVTKDDLRKI